MIINKASYIATKWRILVRRRISSKCFMNSLESASSTSCSNSWKRRALVIRLTLLKFVYRTIFWMLDHTCDVHINHRTNIWTWSKALYVYIHYFRNLNGTINSFLNLWWVCATIVVWSRPLVYQAVSSSIGHWCFSAYSTSLAWSCYYCTWTTSSRIRNTMLSM